MITDKHSQTLIFWCQKSNSRSPTSNLLDKPSVLKHWAVLLIIIKFIKQKWTLQECFSKYSKWSQLDQEAQRNFANVKKVPSTNQQFWRSWKKSVTSFPRLSFGRDTTRLTKPRQRAIRKLSLLIEMAEHDSSHISSLTILDHAQKVKSPPSTSPLFKTFF